MRKIGDKKDRYNGVKYWVKVKRFYLSKQYKKKF